MISGHSSIEHSQDMLSDAVVILISQKALRQAQDQFSRLLPAYLVRVSANETAERAVRCAIVNGESGNCRS